MRKACSDVLSDPSASADLKGWDKERQLKRHKMAQLLNYDEDFANFRKKRKSLLRLHGEALVAVRVADIVEFLPASTRTKQAIQLVQETLLQVAPSQVLCLFLKGP